jgi:uncharacterized protein YpmB
MLILAKLKLWWPWLRWVLVVMAVISAVLIVSQTADYFMAVHQQRRDKKAVSKEAAEYAQWKDARAQRWRRADSSYFLLKGQQQEAARDAQRLKLEDEKATLLLPTRPVLPARPVRP